MFTGCVLFDKILVAMVLTVIGDCGISWLYSLIYTWYANTTFIITSNEGHIIQFNLVIRLTSLVD